MFNAPISRPCESAPALGEEEREDISRLVRRLNRRSPVRAAATTLLEGGTFRAADWDALAAALRRPSETSWRERTAAAWALGVAPLSSELRPAAARLLEDFLDNRRERVGSLLAPLLSLLAEADRNNIARAMAAVSLGRLGVAGSVGALARAAKVTESSVTVMWEARLALKRLLPALRAEDAARFDSDTVPRLCFLLETPNDVVLSEAVLIALEKTRDTRAIEAMEAILEDRYGGNAYWNPARRALPDLLARRGREKDRRTLLRSAREPSDDLLRPAVFLPDEDATTLLRMKDEG